MDITIGEVMESSIKSYNCPKCGQPTTTTKQVTSTKPKTLGEKFTLYVCSTGCMEGQYPFSFFPPWDKKKQSQPQVSQPQPQAQPARLPDSNHRLLLDVNTKLDRILLILSDPLEKRFKGTELHGPE